MTAAEHIDLQSLPVYVVHFAPLVERRAFMERQLGAAGFVGCFLDDVDRYGLPADIRNFYYEFSVTKWNDQIASMKGILAENAQFNEWKSSWNLGVNYDIPSEPARELRASEIGCTIEHLMAYERLCKSSFDMAMVLEDDAVLDERFSRRLRRMLEQAPAGWDFIFLGSCCGLRVPGRRWWQSLYLMNPPRSKCADSYLISKAAAQRILSNAIPFTLVIDFMLGYWMKKLDMKCYWCEPPIVRQGSEIGLFSPATMPRKPRKLSWKAHLWYRSRIFPVLRQWWKDRKH
jgi:GR25 family glycosyltransferase involved in LPS biosynthesis